jgi:lipoprotein-releasing system ATP-binding protein
MGASGTGKSTLLHLLGALDCPTRGEVIVDGERVDFRSDIEMSRIRNRKVGFVFQFHHLLPDFTALENVLMPAKIAGDGGNDAEERAEALLTGLCLCDRLEHRPSELSGGEQQRVAVARALINRPAILLMDEPTGNLDRESGEALMDLLLNFQKERRLSVVMVTHNEVLAARTQKVYRLEDGMLHPQ